MTREEQIRQASIEYTCRNTPMCIGGAFSEMIYELNRNKSFEEGARWADNHPKEGMVSLDKVCKYLDNVLYEVVSGISGLPDVMSIENTTIGDFIKDFRKAMEEK